MAAIFIHHRDLRQIDNIGLNEACSRYKEVYPIFIYTHEQILKNEYFNARSVEFMTGALSDLTVSIYRAAKLYPAALKEILGELKQKHSIEAIYENRDFSPFARRRQEITRAVAAELEMEYFLCEDLSILPMGTFLKKDKKPYVKFTPFFVNAKKHKRPAADMKQPRVVGKRGKQDSQPRKDALKILGRISDWKDYALMRNFPAEDTTRLSRHLQFGTISIREACAAAARIPDLLKQLYWRDFYMYITEYVNMDYSKEIATKKKNIKWKKDPAAFAAWCAGRTGVPIVDAGMAELNQTGYMHNRCRMIVAMFLIYHLHIHWKEGERYFAQNLVDYSYSNNFGGWVWCAGTEVYSNDYYRAFSMEQQSKRFDPDAAYIKKWIPALKNVPAAAIHKWETAHTSAYMKPIVKDLKAARAEGIAMIKAEK